MSAPQMVAHLSDALRMALGELACAPKDVPLARHFPLKHLIIYWLPFPRGAPTARELIARPPGPWDDELTACRVLIERFGSTTLPERWPPHPLFGAMTRHQWGVLAQRHIDHHLRQFGR